MRLWRGTLGWGRGLHEKDCKEKEKWLFCCLEEYWEGAE